MNQVALLSDSQITTLSTADLKREFARALTVTADYLVYMSAIWQELNNRGEDLSDLKSGLMEYVPLIASRQLDARLVVSYAGQKTLLSVLSRLPIEQQHSIAETGTVERVLLDDDDQRVVEIVNLSSIKTSEITQIFADDYVRSVDDQHKLLLMRKNSKSKSKKPRAYTHSRIKFEDDQTLVVGGKSVKIEAMLEALSKHFDVNLRELIKK